MLCTPQSMPHPARPVRAFMVRRDRPRLGKRDGIFLPYVAVAAVLPKVLLPWLKACWIGGSRRVLGLAGCLCFGAGLGFPLPDSNWLMALLTGERQCCAAALSLEPGTEQTLRARLLVRMGLSCLDPTVHAPGWRHLLPRDAGLARSLDFPVCPEFW